MYFKNLLKIILSVMGLSVLISNVYAGAWEDYKQRYLDEDGAIIDTGNNNMSHSEGQSYGMLFALYFNDKDSFDKICKWTLVNLYNEKTGLLNWAYKRNQSDPTADKNNATDGDLMIAWVLIEAGKKWNVNAYTKRGEKMLSVLMSKLVMKMGGSYILLPGIENFYFNSHAIVNPSYYIYPALLGIHKHTFSKRWREISDDGKKLISNLKTQKIKLAPDWIKYEANGDNAPSDKWPVRSSYDAIRVPLYLFWENSEAKELKPWLEWFSRYPASNTPAWVNVMTGETAGYPMSNGLLSVRTLITTGYVPEPKFSDNDDYYNVSLMMLAYLAANHAFM